MSTAFNAPRRTRRPSINITPLIDVMFILLIFLMVSTTFKERLGVDIELPKASTASAQELSLHEISIDAQGNYFFGQQRVDEEGLRTALKDLVASDPAARVVLRADASANFAPVIRAVDIARESGSQQLIIPTAPLSDLPKEP